MQFSLINNQYVGPNSSAHLCRPTFLKKIVKFTCFILFPFMFILRLSALYLLPFGKNIMKFDFFIFRESLLVWNQVVTFLQFFIYVFN